MERRTRGRWELVRIASPLIAAHSGPNVGSMAIFARRRLQTMLDDLATQIAGSKAIDLVRRIESKEIDQALPAEIELALLWALSQIGPIEVEPVWFGANTLPDAFSDDLFPGHETVIEIAGLSDAALPGDQGMRNASRKISHEAGRIRRGAATRLSYYFFEESKYERGEALRWVCVPRELTVGTYIRSALNVWLKEREPADEDRIRLKEGELDVQITWHANPQSQYNFHTSMPPEIRSLRDNYVYGALKRKAKQLRSPEFKGLRCVILADVGSTALRTAGRIDHLNRVYNGGQIVSAYLASKDAGIDVVAIISPNRSRRIGEYEESVRWKTSVFSRPGLELNLAGLEAVVGALPQPRLEGYQSRQWHEQSIFSPSKRGLHVGTNVTWKKGQSTQIRFSARAFLDTLAGRETPERLMRRLSTGSSNIFKLHLDRGETISSIHLESGAPDEDDDWIVVEFRDDPGARVLAAPQAEEHPNQEGAG